MSNLPRRLSPRRVHRVFGARLTDRELEAMLILLAAVLAPLVIVGWPDSFLLRLVFEVMLNVHDWLVAVWNQLTALL